MLKQKIISTILTKSMNRGCLIAIVGLHFIFVNANHVRLRGNSVTNEGRLEIIKGGKWVAVCDASINMNAANVACKQMGFPSAEAVIMGYSRGVKKDTLATIFLDNNCVGTESRIRRCTRVNRSHTCPGEMQVGIRCTPRPKNDLVVKMKIDAKTKLLVAKGRQGVKRHFCSSNWEMVDAIVACREITRGHVKRFLTVPNNNPNLEVPGISNVVCTGNESRMSECEYIEEMCEKFVTVECTDVAPDIVTGLAVLQKSLKVDIKRPQNLTCPREERCLSASGYLSENLHKSRRLLTFSVMVYNIGTADLHPPTTRDTWQWHDCHAHYHSVEELATYELLTEYGEEMGRGHKISFCLRDSVCSSGTKKMYECDKHGVGEQGITVGCGDYYGRDLDCQWIDITDVPAGRYVLRVMLNPKKQFAELNYDNNETLCNVRIGPFGAIFDGRCRTT